MLAVSAVTLLVLAVLVVILLVLEVLSMSAVTLLVLAMLATEPFFVEAQEGSLLGCALLCAMLEICGVLLCAFLCLPRCQSFAMLLPVS